MFSNDRCVSISDMPIVREIRYETIFLHILNKPDVPVFYRRIQYTSTSSVRVN